ncbi:MAG: peptidoglycan -binding protein [Paracoccaceae bacterium]
MGRGRQRFEANIWPGFVDAMTTLLLILMFVLSVFMIVQYTLQEKIDTQGTELTDLSQQLAGLADALGLERAKSAALTGEVAGLTGDLAAAKAEADQQLALITTLTSQVEGQRDALAERDARITSFEAQVASLIAERDSARGEADTLSAERTRLLSDREALNLALASARSEIDAQTEAARLAAARREALEALAADLRARNATEAARAEAAETGLSAAEAAKVAEAEAARLLRERLKSSEDELTAMTLALEAKRKKAEDTLTLLAAADAARQDLDARLAAAVLAQTATAEELAAARAAVEAARTAGVADLQAVRDQLAAALAARLAAEGKAGEVASEAERQAALLAAARTELATQTAAGEEAARKVALLNQQIAALRGQLGALQNLLDASAAKDADAKVQIDALGTQLNSALAQVASEQKRRAELEEAERKRAEAEAAQARAEAEAAKGETKELAAYRSEFFGRLSRLLAGREGVRVVGDRFVFSSEVLFQPASADLSDEGKAQIAGVVQILDGVRADIPQGIDWIIRVDGHTDKTPLSGGGTYADNWELSQARALAVVRYMQDVLGFPPERLAAAGFGEYRPVAAGDDPSALAANRRIELKLTER